MRNITLTVIVCSIAFIGYLIYDQDMHEKYYAINDHLLHQNDSLQRVTFTQTFRADSLTVKLHEQKVLTQFTALKCKKYAKIVQKNPSQAIFIVGWIERSFEWIEE